MQGIDIINMADPNLRERDERSFRLICHPDDDCPGSQLQFWYLWTAKEAIFKAKRDLTAFDPKEIPVKLEKDGKQISFSSGDIKGFIYQEDQLIIAVASKNPEQIMYKIWPAEGENGSLAVREAIVKYYKDEHQLEVKTMEDGNGLPVLDYQNLPISITHHHGYVGFAAPKLK